MENAVAVNDGLGDILETGAMLIGHYYAGFLEHLSNGCCTIRFPFLASGAPSAQPWARVTPGATPFACVI